jgi:hypothetical protein
MTAYDEITTYADMTCAYRLEQQRKRVAIREFVRAVENDGVDQVGEAVSLLQELGALKPAFRRIAGLTAGPVVKQAFLHFWLRYRDALRCDVDGDLTLLDALRVLLPPYNGGDVLLYRGDSFYNRKRRTYGMSWTGNRSVGESFAIKYSSYSAGSVLLERMAPAEAIICAPSLLTESFTHEDEYLIDRRRLRGVRVLERYSPGGDLALPRG